jgi:hypothetical protein
VSVTSGGLDGEHTTSDGQEGDIESTTSEIEDEDNLLLLGLGVKTVGDGSGSWLVDDTENVKAGDGTGVLGSETLRVVEVGWDAVVEKSEKSANPNSYSTAAQPEQLT